jgi:Fic family protein
MSVTEEKNAVRIYEGVQRIALAKYGIWHRYFTVGEAAKAAGMSKPTASKYIDLMLSLGIVVEIDSKNRKERSPRQFKYVETE